MKVAFSRAALIIGVTISLFSQAGETEVDRSDPRTEHVPGEYQSSRTMECGPTTVQLISYCEINEEEYWPECFLQKVVFVNSKTKRTSRKLYLYENYKDDRSVITDMVCVKRTKGVGIVLEGTNFAMCKEDCEWHDYFASSGAFLGSSGTEFGATNFKSAPISDSAFDKLGFVLTPQGRFVELKRVNLPRYW